MANQLTRKERDEKLIQMLRAHTNLTEDDVKLLLDVSHALPFIGNLENGDTYINVLTRDGKSMVVAQYRHPDCDLYKRDILGDVEEKENEPAVYRALEYGISGRGLIGLIDEGKVVVRHTVSPILNEANQVIGSLTYEYLNSVTDTEPLRIRTEGGISSFDGKINDVIGNIQDSFLIYDESGLCSFANNQAKELYEKLGYRQNLLGQRFEKLELTGRFTWEERKNGGMLKSEIQLDSYFLEIQYYPVWEAETFQGMIVLLRDKTRIRQMEDEIAYHAALVQEVHHRVKNNLQMIIGLIGLEAAQTKSDDVKGFARIINGYIRSMSMTYELLAHSGTECVKLKEMLSRITDSVLQARSVCGCRIHMDISGDELLLSEQEASTISLVVNELLTNSMKYAFSGCDDGRITLTIEKGNEYSWITVSDNGHGMEQREEIQGGGGLGLRLVESLVRSSLKGTLTVNSSSTGTTVRFSVKTELDR